MSCMTSKILNMSKTICIISECWNKAEENLRNDIRDNNSDIDEEGITLFFYRQLRKELNQKNAENTIATAFLDDLKELHFLGYRTDDLKKYDGLIADITLHNRTTEGKTGGDFGFVIIRPKLQLYSHTSKSSLLNLSDYQRGILCQAKLKKRNGKWNTPIFKGAQVSVLPRRLKYLSLLLYSYEDNERRLLQPFKWQRCDFPSLSLDQIKEWFKKDSFPFLERSDSIIKQLGNGDIGTTVPDELKEIISPNNNRSLIIRIYWPDDKHPGSEVSIMRRQEVKSRVFQKIRS